MDRIKIGLLTGGYFEYWRMYGGLKEEVEEQMKALAEKMSQRFDIVWSGLADTIEKCDSAGKKFKKEGVDLLIICEGTYFPDYMPIQAMEYLPDIPVLILLTQPHDHVPLDLDYRGSTYHSFGLVGGVQLGGAFKKMKRHFEVVVSSLDDKKLLDKVEPYVNVVFAKKSLRFLNLGIIGHTFQGMYDLEIDKTMLKSTLGANVLYIEVAELLNEYRKADEEKSRLLGKQLGKSYRVEGPDENDLNKACRLALAMESIAEKYKLGGLSHLCQHLIHVETGTTPCYANTRLIDKGIMVTCEGDIGNLVTMCLLHRLTGEVAYAGEWGMYDVKENAMLIVHHGAGSPKLAKSPKDVTITPTGEKWGFKGEGASFRYVGKPGRVTIASLLLQPDGWKMLITKGEAIDVPCRPYWGEQFMIKIDRPVTEYLESLCREGVTHHVAMVYGDVTRQLGQFADLLKIKKAIL